MTEMSIMFECIRTLLAVSMEANHSSNEYSDDLNADFLSIQNDSVTWNVLASDDHVALEMELATPQSFTEQNNRALDAKEYYCLKSVRCRSLFNIFSCLTVKKLIRSMAQI